MIRPTEYEYMKPKGFDRVLRINGACARSRSHYFLEGTVFLGIVIRRPIEF